MFLNMMDRPRLVTTIAWWFILSGIYGAVISATMELNPLAVQLAARSGVPLAVQEIYGLINGFVIAASGIGFLKGLWWSRLVYLGWTVLRLASSLFLAPFWVFLLGLVIFSVILSMLYRRSVNLWFEVSSY